MPAPITKADLIGAKITLCFRARLQGGSLAVFTCPRFPALTISDHYDKKTRKATRTYVVSGADSVDLDADSDATKCADLDEVAAALNKIAEA